VTSLPPLDVRVNARRRACVLDIALALSPWGVMFPWRMADEMDIWLVPSFWDLLDGADYYLQDPGAFRSDPASGFVEEGRDPRGFLDTLAQWQTARLEADLPSVPVYWAGDARHESLLPKGVSGDLMACFPMLAASLERMLPSGSPEFEPGNPFADCTRDAAALAAVLGRHRPIVFSLAPSPGETPYICRYLAACGIPCRELASRNGEANPMQRHLQPAFLRSGIAELIWSGMSLVALHIVAPKAFLVPQSGEDDCTYDEDLPRADTRAPSPGWWDGAVATWYGLS
jgi:hypothetical protein